MRLPHPLAATLRCLGAAAGTIALAPAVGFLGAWGWAALAGEGTSVILPMVLMPMLVCGWLAVRLGFKWFVPVVVVLAGLSAFALLAYLVGRALQHGFF